MPAYDYRCPACNDVFEVTRAAGATENVCCPSCGTVAKRVFTPVGVVFKGSGFHNTDYRAKPREDGSPTPSTPDAPSTSETPSCPAAKDGGCSSCPAAS